MRAIMMMMIVALFTVACGDATPTPGTATRVPLAPATAISRPAPLFTVSQDNVDYDCPDFSTRREAQAYFDQQGGSASNNIDKLDRDGDGVACETLP